MTAPLGAPLGAPPSAPPGAPAWPLVVIGGYLGAGKTTLVNHLLREEARTPGGRRIAVLVNDFGEIAIDADLIEGADGGVLSLAGGCVCCSDGGDLLGALAQLRQREPPPDVVLVETSGVGLPAAVARTARLAPGYAIEGIVVVADAAALRQQVSAPYVGATVMQQLHEADLLVLSRTDLLAHADAEIAALEAWLREQAVHAPAVRAVRGDVAAAVVLGVTMRAAFGATAAPVVAQAPAQPMRLARPIAPAFVARTLRYARPVDIAALGATLRAEGALRAKGWVLDAGSGQWHELQLAGHRVEWRAALPPSSLADAAAGLLVVIGAVPDHRRPSTP